MRTWELKPSSCPVIRTLKRRIAWLICFSRICRFRQDRKNQLETSRVRSENWSQTNTSRARPRRHRCRCNKVSHERQIRIRLLQGRKGGKLNNQERLKLAFVVVVLIIAAMSPGCSRKATVKPTTIKLVYAYYNPVSLVLKDKKFLEQDLASDGISVEWSQSLGSNKALELLNSKSVDFGSTAGAAALIGKANGNPIKAIYVYSRPEWTALVVRKDSPITKIEDLKGKRVAVTRGTDPHIFLLRALNEAGLTEKDVEIVVLQHPEGRIALEKGDVDAWAGLDPMMAQTEIQSGSRLFYRNVNFNSYGVLNVREEFPRQYPPYGGGVLGAYEKARLWALQNPEEFRKVLAHAARLDDSVVTK